MSIRARTFPGVYATVRDDSYVISQTSRFNAGLVGPAEKGPFNVATKVRSLREFTRTFGKSLSRSYLANAAAILSDLSDGTYVVRIGRQYEELGLVGTAIGSGNSLGAYQLVTRNADDDGIAPTVVFKPGEYVRVREYGKKTSVAKVGQTIDHDASAGTPDQLVAYADAAPTVLLLDNTAGAPGLQDTYTTAAKVFRSTVASAANEAEAFLLGNNWVEVVESSPVVVSGTKNGFKLSLSGGTASDRTAMRTALKHLPDGRFRLTQTGKVTTYELRIKEVRDDDTIILENTNNTEYGYQSLPLQDTYTGAAIFKHDGARPTIAHVFAASAGTWANTDGAAGLKLQVSPGSVPGTKKILVYENSALVETIDNLSDSAESTDYYETRINGKSDFITIKMLTAAHPANTIDGWRPTVDEDGDSGTPEVARVNVNVATFSGGENGEDVTDSDFVGEINPADEAGTGLKAFTDVENVDVDVLWCSPIQDTNGLDTGTSVAVAQELDRVAGIANAIAFIDVPRKDNNGLVSARLAIDWHNGAGVYSGRGKLDTYRLACFWNWFTVTDPFTGMSKDLPPSIAALRCMAFTFDAEKPWYAIAGPKRGLVPEALALNYTKLSQDTKDAMYGEGNSVNPILVDRGIKMLYGERTMQRRESKLTAIHSVVVTNEIIKGLTEIGKQFIFDPNDSELLMRLRLAFTSFLDKIVNERGVEEYNLVMDEKNNKPDNRNRREVIVDLEYVPTDVFERLFLTATTKQSGGLTSTSITNLR